MNRIPIAIGAAAVVVIAGALVVSRPGTGPDVGATPSRSASGSPSPSLLGVTGAIPAQLRSFWMGDESDLVAPGAGTVISLDEESFYLAQSAGSAARLLTSSASLTDGKLRLEATASARECETGDVGQYAWSLNPTGRILTISEDREDCPARAAAVSGTWWLMGCPASDDNCLGLLDAGTYESQFIAPRLDPGASWAPVYGALTYTVPSGWANLSDWPGSFELAPATDMPPVTEAERTGNIGLFTQPTAMTQDRPCSDQVEPDVGRTVAELVEWLDGVPGLITTAPTAITLDGHPGQMLDLSLEPAWTKSCEAGGEPIVTFLNPGIAVAAESRVRLYLVDLGEGDVVAIAMWARNGSTFDALLPEATTVIESFRFK